MAVGAGKGGVGKSTVALGLARALRRHGPVGILDLDLHAPDIPAMLGIANPNWTHSFTLASVGDRLDAVPVERDGLAVVSTGFLLGEDQPMGLEGQSLELLTRNLVDGVDWPHLEYLVVDLPAGTSALQHTLARRLRVAGAIVVVTPQRVAHLDVLKVVRLYRHLRVPILGGVENMAYVACPHCGEQISLFDRADTQQTIWAHGIEKLASLPFSGELERARALAALADVVVGLTR